jgi:hypothetical protein
MSREKEPQYIELFELFHTGNVALGTRIREAYLFRRYNLFGQTSPLDLLTIFLKRFNLVLGRSLDWIIRITVDLSLKENANK